MRSALRAAALRAAALLPPLAAPRAAAVACSALRAPAGSAAEASAAAATRDAAVAGAAFARVPLACHAGRTSLPPLPTRLAAVTHVTPRGLERGVALAAAVTTCLALQPRPSSQAAAPPRACFVHTTSTPTPQVGFLGAALRRHAPASEHFSAPRTPRRAHWLATPPATRPVSSRRMRAVQVRTPRHLLLP
jgi:hypothetical protein